MPEAPEVETTRRIVEQELTGLSIRRAEVRLPKLLRLSEIPSLQTLEGHTVLGARRRAKLLIVDFSGDLTLIVHFKLAGQLSVHRPTGRRATAGHPVPKPDGPYPHKSTHIDLVFDDGTVAYLSDIRQFSWLRLMPSGNVDAAIADFAFGPEAAGENRITAQQLAAGLKRRSIPVKLALLDQGLVAGIGNIYADEALHRARVHPVTPANALPRRAVNRLWEGIDWALGRGLKQGGAKIVHQKAFPIDGFPAVHGREGDLCPICGTAVRKTKIGTRGTYFCPKCQKKRGGILISRDSGKSQPA
ncbi:DNA-formamidopyrimidine glycosylase [soil metagenome]